MALHTHVILIRGIGPDSHRLMTMKQLEAAVAKAGKCEVKSVLATGNFIVNSNQTADEIVALFSAQMSMKQLSRPIIVRSIEQLVSVAESGVLRDAAATRPARVQVTFFEKPIAKAGLVALNARANKEEICTAAGELVIDFCDGISNSKITPGFMDRCAGSPGTSRNWNTVLRIIREAKKG